MPGNHEIELLLRRGSYIHFLRGIVAHGCTPEHRLNVNLPRCETYRPATDVTTEKLLAGIRYALDSTNPQPAAVSYCSQVLKKGRSFKGVVDGRAIKSCRRHVSLIIGRRQQAIDGGVVRCQYLIRNSWGLKTKKYSHDWQIDKGNIWVDADALIANAYGVSYLE